MTSDSLQQLPWDHPNPFLTEVIVTEQDIDQLGHTNNTRYISWCEETAWAHSASLGVTLEMFCQHRRALAIRRNEFDYERATGAGDHLLIGTWIVDWGESMLKDRRFQIIRSSDGRTVSRGLMQFVCVDMDTGGPRRMPDSYAKAYRSVAIPEWPRSQT